MTMIDKWIALPAKTPAPLVESYRAAFRRLVADPQFVNAGKEMGEDFAPMTDRDVASILRTLHDTPPEAMQFTSDMLRRQGIDVDQ